MCQAAAGTGLRSVVTDFQINTTTAGTATTIKLVYGTGTNCGTGTTDLSTAYPNTAVGVASYLGWTTGLVPGAATAICAAQAGTTAGTSVVWIAGYTN